VGWTYLANSTRSNVITEVLSDRHHETVDHAIVGNTVWAVKKIPDREDIPPEYRGKRFIACFLIRGNGEPGFRWGYKDMDESSGPYYYDCPLRFLEAVPDPGGYATKWREKVVAWHRSKAARRARVAALRVGEQITLVKGYRPPTVRVASVKPLTGYGPDGTLYSLQPRHIAVPTDFDPAEVGGAFDGLSTVTSDADPYL
jgi:hypothetical protein